MTSPALLMCKNQLHQRKEGMGWLGLTYLIPHSCAPSILAGRAGVTWSSRSSWCGCLIQLMVTYSLSTCPCSQVFFITVVIPLSACWYHS
jgi:hypothetical protein